MKIFHVNKLIYQIFWNPLCFHFQIWIAWYMLLLNVKLVKKLSVLVAKPCIVCHKNLFTFLHTCRHAKTIGKLYLNFKTTKIHYWCNTILTFVCFDRSLFTNSVSCSLFDEGIPTNKVILMMKGLISFTVVYIDFLYKMYTCACKQHVQLCIK